MQKEIQQLDQPDNAIVTVRASRFARSCTNRANYALQVIQMFSGLEFVSSNDISLFKISYIILLVWMLIYSYTKIIVY